MLWIVLAIFLASIYAFLILRYLIVWLGTPTTHSRPLVNPFPVVTILIAARNEEDRIADLLRAVLAQDYPAFDVILVDDHSDDNTVEIALATGDSRLRIVELEKGEEGKKMAIAKGINKVRGELVLLTDADCVMRQGWMRTMVNALLRQTARVVTGPVLIGKGRGVLTVFQELEYLGMAAVTSATKFHFLGNGANLLLAKKTFEEVGGFAGNDQFSSGDDLFLIEKIQRLYPDSLEFCKSREAVVYTKAEETVRGFLRQRLRWAGKNKALKDQRISRIWSGLWLFHFVFFLFLTGAFLSASFVLPFCIILFSKMICELILLSTLAAYFKENRLPGYFPLIFPLYALYVFIVGLLAISGVSQEWKGRKVKQSE